VTLIIRGPRILAIRPPRPYGARRAAGSSIQRG